MDLHRWNKKKLSEIIIKTDELLVNFHHNLFRISGYSMDGLDNSQWFQQFGNASAYYYFYLLHFVVHGVWFENIEPYYEDGSTSDFILNVTYPAIQKIEEKFGVRPLVVRMYPLNQNVEEDFYWWSYPKNVNDWIVKYAKENNLTFKKIDL